MRNNVISIPLIICVSIWIAISLRNNSVLNLIRLYPHFPRFAIPFRNNGIFRHRYA